ncbi:hypothetical protein LJC48_01800 [Desulfovibrio sp. OttesenSCG-928-C06]|nr:hypothetical protein [Desulfovibrio sp. OttesenSCG-928-C06]
MLSRPLAGLLASFVALTAEKAFAASNFSEVRESFFSSGGDYSTIMRLMVIAGVLLLLICIVSVIRHMRKQREVFIPTGWITSPKVLRDLISSAFRQRSTFDMQFADIRGQRRPTLRCAMRYLENDRIGLEAQGVQKVARRWTGRKVTCYFKISIKEQPVYYTFTTPIADVELRQIGTTIIWLQYPEKLQNRQKRAFLRIVPPEEYMLGAALWHGRKMPDVAILGDVQQWEKPNMALLPGKIRQFEISDVSAGGLRLTVPRKEQLATGTEFNVSDRLILLVDFMDPENNKRMRFWLLCRVQNMANEYNLRNLEIGVRFQAWAMPGDGGSNIEWFKLTNENEVAPLGNWIIRRHLELFRANPEEELER